MRARFGTYGAVLAVTLLALSSQAVCAGVDQGLKLLRQQEQDRALRQLREAPEGVQIQPPKAAEARSAVCFEIRDIDVSGVETVRPDVIQWAVSPFTDRCLGQIEIEQLIGRIKATYLARGLITVQVGVPQQDLKSGRLRLQVVEGRVGALDHRMMTDDGTAEPVNPLRTFLAFPFVAGHVLNLRDLEQGIAQINRLASVSATLDIEPGDEPGTSRVKVLEQRERSLRLSAGFDTNGQEATGRLRRKAALEIDDAFHLLDAWSLTYAGAENSNALAGTVSVPFGSWTLNGALSLSDQDQMVSPVADMITTSASWSGGLDWVAYRDSNTILHLGQSLNWYWNERYINAAQLTPQYLTWTRSSIQIERFFSAARLSVEIGRTSGLPDLGGDDDPAGIPVSDAHARFGKWDASATMIAALPAGFSYLGTASAQWSGVGLYSPQQMTPGGWEAVRGFRDLGNAGDSGVYLRNEIQWGVAMPWGRATDPRHPKAPPVAPWADFTPKGLANQVLSSATPYGFFDIGSVRARADDIDRTLASVGLGLRASGERLSMDVALALPVLVPAGQTAGLEANLTLNARLW